MKIYTKTGDDGTTGLFGGARVSKDALRVDAYGTVDETNAVIGTARAAHVPADIDAILSRAQADLFAIGAELACAPGKEHKLSGVAVGGDQITRLEREIDEIDARLPELRSFVLPTGTTGGAALHHARTVCRRAERRIIELSRTEAVRSEVLVYLNRLSDLLFVLARGVNHAAGTSEEPWIGR